MTSASELFHTRRSRFGRNSNPFDIGLESDSSSSPGRSNRRFRHSDPHNHNSLGGNNSRRERLELEGCDPLRRHLQQPRHHPSRRSSHPPQERDPIRFDQSSHQLDSGNFIQSGSQSNVRDGLMFSGNGRLPGAVLLARERLLQRLRGITLSENRNSRRSSDTDILTRDEFRLIDAGDWETEASWEWLAAIPAVSDSFGPQTNLRPPGLTQEAFNSLCVEVFSFPNEGDEPAISKVSRDCSICLENFADGDKLICLLCGHKFHHCCLDPWVRICGDCPNCRRGIVLTTDQVNEGSKL